MKALHFHHAIIATVVALLMLPTACATYGTGPTSFDGTWTGYLSQGENTTGTNTMTITKDLSCTLYAEISGSLPGWNGPYTLRLEGDLLIDNLRVSGPIAITRFRTGIDTVQVAGYWSGEFFLDARAASGGWVTYMGEAFSAEGRWGASKQ